MTTHESENSLDFLGKLLENTKITQKFSASFGKGISTGAIWQMCTKLSVYCANFFNDVVHILYLWRLLYG